MNENKKFSVAIEETLVQEFEIFADTAEKAMEIAKEKYKECILILSSGEVQFKQIAIVRPEKEATEWCEF